MKENKMPRKKKKDPNIRNERKKEVVNSYVEMLSNSIDKFIADNPRMTKKKNIYLDGMRENIKRAPYVLGYLYWEKKDEPKKKKTKKKKK